MASRIVTLRALRRVDHASAVWQALHRSFGSEDFAKNHTVRCCLKGKIQASLMNWWGQSNEGVFHNLYGHTILNPFQWRAPSPRFVILNREKAAVVLSRRSFSSNADGKKLGPLAGVRVLDMTRVLAGQEKSDSASVQLCKWFETNPNFTTHLITLTHVESHHFTLTSEAFQHQTMKQLWQTVLRSGRTMLHSDLGWSWRWNRQAWKTQSGWWHPRFRTAFPTWCWRGAFEQGNMEKIRESNEKSCLLRIQWFQCPKNLGMQIQYNLPKDKKWGKTIRPDMPDMPRHQCHLTLQRRTATRALWLWTIPNPRDRSQSWTSSF